MAQPYADRVRHGYADSQWNRSGLPIEEIPSDTEKAAFSGRALLAVIFGQLGWRGRISSVPLRLPHLHASRKCRGSEGRIHPHVWPRADLRDTLILYQGAFQGLRTSPFRQCVRRLPVALSVSPVQVQDVTAHNKHRSTERS
jgi:hypothetical protein